MGEGTEKARHGKAVTVSTPRGSRIVMPFLTDEQADAYRRDVPDAEAIDLGEGRPADL